MDVALLRDVTGRHNVASPAALGGGRGTSARGARAPIVMVCYHLKGERTVPEISRFFGIVVRMYFSDHEPPHFHAVYGEAEALIAIETLEALRGELPRRALLLVLEWAMLHRNALREDWQLARAGMSPKPIDPLE